MEEIPFDFAIATYMSVLKRWNDNNYYFILKSK